MLAAFIVLSTTLYYIFFEVERPGQTDVARIVRYIHWEFLQSAPTVVIVIVCNWTCRQVRLTNTPECQKDFPIIEIPEAVNKKGNNKFFTGNLCREIDPWDSSWKNRFANVRRNQNFFAAVTSSEASFFSGWFFSSRFCTLANGMICVNYKEIS